MLMWKTLSGSYYQDVTFANGSLPYIHSTVTVRPISIETKCHFRSNLTQKRSYRTDEGRQWHFRSLVPFLQLIPTKNSRVIFSPIQYFKIKRNHTCQSCLHRWQLPRGTVTVHGPLFQFETAPMLGHLLCNSEYSRNQQRMEVQGLFRRPRGQFDM